MHFINEVTGITQSITLGNNMPGLVLNQLPGPFYKFWKVGGTAQNWHMQARVALRFLWVGISG